MGKVPHASVSNEASLYTVLLFHCNEHHSEGFVLILNSSWLFLWGWRGCSLSFPQVDLFASPPVHSPGTARHSWDGCCGDTHPKQRRHSDLWHTGVPSYSHVNQTEFNTTCIGANRPEWANIWLVSLVLWVLAPLTLWGLMLTGKRSLHRSRGNKDLQTWTQFFNLTKKLRWLKRWSNKIIL